MGLNIESMGSGAGAVAGGTPWGAIATEGMGIVGGLIGMATQKRNEKRAMKNQEKLMSIQQQNQMGLNQQGKDLALQQWKDTNYSAQREEMEKAGLNPGLMYGMSGGGGTTANAGSGGSASGGQAPAPQRPVMDMQSMMQMALLGAQKANIEASTEKTKAETVNVGANTKTTEGTRDILIENLRQSGINTMLGNEMEVWLRSDHAEGEVEVNKNKTYGTQSGVTDTSRAVQLIDKALLKTESETNANLAGIDLTNAKVQGYWTELLNATKNADSERIKANAMKLSTEWNTGEFTNWKTWADVATNAVNSIGGAIKNVKGGGKVDASGTRQTTVNNY